MILPERAGAAFAPTEAFISSEHFKDSCSGERTVRNQSDVGGRGRGLSTGGAFGNVWRCTRSSQLGSCYHHGVGEEKRR